MKNNRAKTLNFRKCLRSIILGAALASGLTGCFATPSKQIDISLKESLPAANTAQSGWRYLDQGEYGAAIPAFQLALSKNPDDENLHFGIAESFRYLGAIERAEIYYAKLLNSARYRVGALTGVGYIKLASQDNSGAYEMFSQAIAEDDTAWKAWLGLASLSDQARDWIEAELSYQNALATTDKRAVVLNNYGISMLARGDAAAALVYFEMAEQIAPNSERIKNNRIFAQLDVNNGRRRSDNHLNGKELAKRLNNRGYIEMVRGNSSKAEEYFAEAIDAHPSFYATAHKNLKTLHSINKTHDKE